MVHKVLEEHNSLLIAQTTNGTVHKQGATKLMKLFYRCLLTVIFLVRQKPFHSIWKAKNNYLHST